MAISIVTRAYRSSELTALSNNLSAVDESEFEVIAVCNQIDSDIENFTLLRRDVGRFGAKIEGIKKVNYNRILFIDSDQFPEKGLLSELRTFRNDMVIIPERSAIRGFVATCLDDLRIRSERGAIKDPTPSRPVIPRYYKTDLLLDTIDKLPDSSLKITNHEDSIFYNEAYKHSSDIAFCGKYIFNSDPDFFILLRKAFEYGKSTKNVSKTELPDEIIKLGRKLDRCSLNISEIGLGPGYLMQLSRAIAFQFGVILG